MNCLQESLEKAEKLLQDCEHLVVDRSVRHGGYDLEKLKEVISEKIFEDLLGFVPRFHEYEEADRSLSDEEEGTRISALEEEFLAVRSFSIAPLFSFANAVIQEQFHPSNGGDMDRLMAFTIAYVERGKIKRLFALRKSLADYE